MSDKILQMFFDIGRWKKAIEKGVLKDIRKDQLIRLTDEHTRMAMADAMIQGKYEIAPPHTAQIPKENGEFRTVYINEPVDRVVLGIANDLLFEQRGRALVERSALRLDAVRKILNGATQSTPRIFEASDSTDVILSWLIESCGLPAEQPPLIGKIARLTMKLSRLIAAQRGQKRRELRCLFNKEQRTLSCNGLVSEK